MSKHFSLDEVYVFLMERSVRQFRKYAKKVLDENEIDLSGEQWVILKRISENPGINQREIAGITYKDPASVTRIIDILEKKGYMKRQNIKDDRRAYALHLTSLGEQTVEKVIPIAKKVQQQGLKNVSAEELNNLKNILNKIYENFE